MKGNRMLLDLADGNASTFTRIAAPLAVAVALALTGCSSPTEKATKFYGKGMALLEEGNLGKARIEFQNALQIREGMTEAWYGLALVAERQGEWERLFGLLKKVVDRDPKHLDANLKLGRLLVAAGNLDEALKVSNLTMELNADHAGVLALRAAVLFRLEDVSEALQQANRALEKDPKNIDALVVLATERLAANDAGKAIEYLDQGLQINERNLALQLMKVQALEKVAKLESAEAVLKKLIALYPDIAALRHVLAQFYLGHRRADAAEAEYRAFANANPSNTEARLDVVRFINATKGAGLAISELDGFISKDPGNHKLKFALVELYEAQNNRNGAEAVLKSVIKSAGDGAESIKAKGMLAAVWLTAGNKAGAKELVAEILTKDQRNEQGLLLKSGMAIDDRQLDAAIADLRSILRDVPDSARALLLLGKAHELAGAPELAQEHYLKAFQASKLAPRYGIALGEFLLKRGQVARAEGVFEDVLRVSPRNVAAMKLLAQARLNKGDWAGAQKVADDLRKVGDKNKSAEQVMGMVYALKKNYAESISSFKRAFEAAPSEVQPIVALVRTYLQAGKTNEALAFLGAVVKAAPGNVNARLLQGQVYASRNDVAAASQSFQAVIETQPKNPLGYVSLANLHMGAGRHAEAAKVVAQGLAAVPDDFSLRMAEAGAHELAGRYEEAIQRYEKLLKERPNADVVANNLASLLSDHRTDKASLSRAQELAQRFKRADTPQFKDTLAWVNHKLGKSDVAVALLEDATKQMPEFAVFRYHLGMSYLAQNKKDAARKELEKALALGGAKGFAEAEQVKQALKKL
jgi:cellulose synthase operon protein C